MRPEEYMNKNSKTFKKLVSAFMCTIIPCSNIISIKAINNNELKSENHENEKASGSWTKLLWLLVPTAMIGGTIYAYREHPEIFKLLKPNLEETDIQILQNIKENSTRNVPDLQQYIFEIPQRAKYNQENFLDIIKNLCNLTGEIENLQEYYHGLKIQEKYLVLSFFEIYKKKMLEIDGIPDSHNETIDQTDEATTSERLILESPSISDLEDTQSIQDQNIDLVESTSLSESFMLEKLNNRDAITTAITKTTRTTFFQLFNKTGIESHQHRLKFHNIQDNEIKLDNVLPDYAAALNYIGLDNQRIGPNIYNLKRICDTWFPNTYISDPKNSHNSEKFSDFLFNTREITNDYETKYLSRYDELMGGLRTLHLSTYQFYPRFFCWLDQKAQELGFEDGKDIENYSNTTDNNKEKEKFKELYGELQSIISAFDLECYVQLVEGAGYILNRIYEYYPVVESDATELKINTFNRILLPSIKDQIADECFNTLYKTKCNGDMQNAEYRTSYNCITSRILGIDTISEIDTHFDDLALTPFSVLDLAKIARKHLTPEFILREVSQNSHMFTANFQDRINDWFGEFAFNKSKYELLNSMYGGKLTDDIKEFTNRKDIYDSTDLRNLTKTLEKLISGQEVTSTELFDNVVDPALADSGLLSDLQSKVCCLYKFVTDMNDDKKLFTIAYVFKLMDAEYLSF